MASTDAEQGEAAALGTQHVVEIEESAATPAESGPAADLTAPAEPGVDAISIRSPGSDPASSMVSAVDGEEGVGDPNSLLERLLVADDPPPRDVASDAPAAAASKALGLARGGPAQDEGPIVVDLVTDEEPDEADADRSGGSVAEDAQSAADPEAPPSSVRPPPGLEKALGIHRPSPRQGFISAPPTPAHPRLSLEALQAAAAERSKAKLPVLLSEAIMSVDRPQGMKAPAPSHRMAANANFICILNTSRTEIQVVSQASLSAIPTVSFGGCCIADFALQKEDSHLLVVFESGRLVVCQLTPERVATRVVLEFGTPSPRAVSWHPLNPRLFLTMGAQQSCLWHLKLIAQFAMMRPAGCEPLPDELAPTALRVTAALQENGSREVVPRLDDILTLKSESQSRQPQNGSLANEETRKADADLACVAFTQDGGHLAASGACCIWLWHLRVVDEQTAPEPSCLLRCMLPEEAQKKVACLHFFNRPETESRCTSSGLVAVTAYEVLLYDLKLGDSSSQCSLVASQRLAFHSSIAADILMRRDTSGSQQVALVVAATNSQEHTNDSAARGPFLLLGHFADDGASGCLLPIPELAVFEAPPALTGCMGLDDLCTTERSPKPCTVTEGVETHDWAVVTLAPGGPCRLGLPTCIWAPPLPQAPSESEAPPPVQDVPSFGEQWPHRTGAPAQPRESQSSALLGEEEVDAATIASESLDAQSRPKDSQRNGVQRSDNEPLTSDMLEELTNFMHRRTLIASEDLAERVQNCTELLSANGPIYGSRPQESAEKSSTAEQRRILNDLLKEGCSLLEQLAGDEKAAVQAVKKSGEAETLKQGLVGKQYKEIIEKEVAKWRESLLSKAVLKAVEGKTFAERFSEGLQTGNPETAPLMDAVRPGKKQLSEDLQALLLQWCANSVARNFRSILAESDVQQARSALDVAMREVTSQADKALDKILEQTRANADASKLAHKCGREIATVVRAELQRWEGKRGQHAAPSPSEARFVKDGFARRMRAAVRPMQEELSAVEKHLGSTSEMLSWCRTAAASSESGARGAANLDSELAAVRRAVADGRLGDALARALAWDSRHEQAEVSLVELACDQVRREFSPSTGGDPAEVDEVLKRSEVAGEIAGRSRLELMQALLARALRPATSIERLEANLDWVLGLLQVGDGEDSAFVTAVDAVHATMAATLELLQRGEQPPALASASQGQRRGIAKSAREAQKMLSLMVRWCRGARPA